MCRARRCVARSATSTLRYRRRHPDWRPGSILYSTLESVQDLMRHEDVIAVEMMNALLFDHLGALLHQIGAIRARILVAVEALDHFSGDVLDGQRPRRPRGAGTGAEPAAHANFPVGGAPEAQQRNHRDMLLQARPQAIIGEWQRVGAEREADQRDLVRMPFGAVVENYGRKVGGGLLRSLALPEIAHAVPADDRNAQGLQVFGDGLVDIPPATVSRQEHGHQTRRL